MEEKKVIAISVHNLLEYVHQSGDLSSGTYSSSRAVEGTRGHAAVRKTLKNTLAEDIVYEAEVPISFSLIDEKTILEVTGRTETSCQEQSFSA